MAKGELDKILGTLQILTQVESSMSRYYTACSETWEKLSRLWMDLAIEEEKHERIMIDLARIVKAHPDQFRIGLDIETSAIDSFIASINEKVPDLRKGKVTLKEALDFALGIEESIIEGRFFELVVSQNPRFLKFMEAMNSDLVKHRQRIIEELGKL
jgi:rubrerythrin